MALRSPKKPLGLARLGPCDIGATTISIPRRHPKHLILAQIAAEGRPEVRPAREPTGSGPPALPAGAKALRSRARMGHVAKAAR